VTNRAERQIKVQCVVFDFHLVDDDRAGHQVCIAKHAEIVFSVRRAFLTSNARHVAILARFGGIRRLRMFAHRFLHAIDVGSTRTRKCKIVATAASGGGCQACVPNDFMPVFSRCNGMCSDDSGGDDVA
jgi:hypothetical protein